MSETSRPSASVGRPASSEYPPPFAGYVGRVPEDDVLAVLGNQIREFKSLLASVSEKSETFRYAPGKWSIRQIAGHLVDAERVLGFRALCFARGEAAPLPGFDEDVYVGNAPFDSVRLARLVEELDLLRRADVLFFSALDPQAWGRAGIANNAKITVRALAYALAGHMRHHMATLEERYLPGLGAQ